MVKEIKPCDPVRATLTLPGSKSYTHRALVAASLAVGDSLLSNPLRAEDTELTAQALAKLGAGIDWEGAAVRVQGAGGRWLPLAEPIYLGNSGTSMRFLTALTALGQGTYRLTGTERLCQRPMDELLQALGQLGVRAASEGGEGRPPVVVQGGLQGGRAVLSGAVSSQYLSALLFISPLAPAGVEIEITAELVSRPYVDLTLEVMGDLRRLLLSPGLLLFQGAGGADLPAPGLCHRGRRLQRLVLLGRGRGHRWPGDHRQPGPGFLPGRRLLPGSPGADGLRRGRH